jgi:3-hydroxy-9,10-secoandrosta-1,3,5(10)-triene-9,17-dione monooxygenase reductase component
VVTIHSSDPFATPEHLRSPVRKMRARLAAAVTLWTAYEKAGSLDASRPRAAQFSDHPRAGLTVSSTLVADGEPGRLLGLIDEESDLWSVAEAAGRFAVTLLGPADQQLADRFAGLLPAPGGPFQAYGWSRSDWGPIPSDHGTWVGCRLDGARPYGWNLLVEATIEHVEVGDDAPLVHHRGRYRSLS